MPWQPNGSRHLVEQLLGRATSNEFCTPFEFGSFPGQSSASLSLVLEEAFFASRAIWTCAFSENMKVSQHGTPEMLSRRAEYGTWSQHAESFVARVAHEPRQLMRKTEKKSGRRAVARSPPRKASVESRGVGAHAIQSAGGVGRHARGGGASRPAAVPEGGASR